MFFWYFHPYAELNSGFSGQEITENVLGRVRGRGKRCPILRELPRGVGGGRGNSHMKRPGVLVAPFRG